MSELPKLDVNLKEIEDAIHGNLKIELQKASDRWGGRQDHAIDQGALVFGLGTTLSLFIAEQNAVINAQRKEIIALSKRLDEMGQRLKKLSPP